jgi:hypothetical protein
VAQQRAGQVIPTCPATRPPPDKVPRHLEQATMVYMRKGAKGPLVPPYSGPYKVLRRGPKVFHIEVGGVEQIVTVDRLKPHLGAATADPAAPAKRGHPPAARAAPAAQAATEEQEQQAAAAGPATTLAAAAPAAQAASRVAREQSPGLPATTSARPARGGGGLLD